MASGESSPADFPPPPFQFTLRQLMAATAVVCVLAALCFWLGPGLGLLAILPLSAITCAIYFLTRRRYGEAFFAFFFGGILTCLLLPAVQSPHISSGRASCNNNLHSLALALLQYHDDNGSYPPPYIADDNGKPMHSWRVLLLPYLDQRPLYKQYRFDEPWDGPNNRQLHGIVLKLYSCPSRPPNQSATDTSYVAVIGPKTTFPEAGGVRMADIIDGTSATTLLVEVAGSGIHWMEPRDLHIHQMPMAINPAQGQGISSAHKNGANVSFADGSIRFLTNDTPPITLRAIFTRSGKESKTTP